MKHLEQEEILRDKDHMNIIFKYIRKRSIAIYIEKIVETPSLLSFAIEKLGNSKKTTQYQVDSIVNVCKDIQNSIDEDVEKLKSIGIEVSKESTNRIKNIDIIKLIDCKEFARALNTISFEVNKQKKINPIYIPWKIGGVYYLLHEILLIFILILIFLLYFLK